MTLTGILLSTHSIIRWLLLLLLLISIFSSFLGLKNHTAYGITQRKLVSFSVICAHLQLLIGLILYFISPMMAAYRQNLKAAMGSTVPRFWVVEHAVAMIIAIVLITLGSSMSKKMRTSKDKHKKVAIYFTIALIIILLTIPWPFIEAGAGRSWF